MKSLFLITVFKILRICLIFSLPLIFTISSSKSFADWSLLSKNIHGDTYYIDFEKVQKHNGFVYYWVLSNYLKPRNSNLSAKMYVQGDCKLFRFKYLDFKTYKEPMGVGNYNSSKTPSNKWNYPPTNSNAETFLETVCKR